MALFAPKSYMLELFPAIKVRFNGKYPNSLLAYYYPYTSRFLLYCWLFFLPKKSTHTQHCLTFIGLLGEIKLVSLLLCDNNESRAYVLYQLSCRCYWEGQKKSPLLLSFVNLSLILVICFQKSQMFPDCNLCLLWVSNFPGKRCCCFLCLVVVEKFKLSTLPTRNVLTRDSL